MLKFKDFNVKELKQNSSVQYKDVRAKDVAVIGMAVRLAKSQNSNDFWNTLCQGIDCIGDLPECRKKDVEKYIHHTDKGKEKIEYGKAAYLPEVDKFDYEYFKISPKEASLMDPNQRMFLEVAYEAMEDAGYGGNKMVGSNTGIYLGHGSMFSTQYLKMITDVDPSLGATALPGNIPAVTASRIAYLLDLKGPSLLVDTTCSSSLVAIHLACQSIRNGECDMVIAGGVKADLLPLENNFKIGIESSSGRTKTFDDSADGTGSGEGVIAILLKPLSKAMQDRDNIYAVIKGSAINQDGNSIGLTAPNALAQEDVIVKAWKDAGIEPDSISYIEAHGTGTKLGDPIEIDGVSRAFRRFTDKKRFCAIGAVKSNIGHLDNAAGAAGLVKSVLALKNKMIPPSIHFTTPNREIDFDNAPVFVNDKLRTWEKNSSPLRCGISAFGLSGTNCHIVLEEKPEFVSTQNNNAEIPNVLTLSAKTQEALQELIKRYIDYLTLEKDLCIKDICFTANTGRGHYNYRLAIIVKGKDELQHKLRKILNMEKKNKREEGIYFNSLSDVNKEEAAKHDNETIIHSIEGYKQEPDESSLKEIVELYIDGCDINWDSLYQEEDCTRVSLPVYPFERRRCWIHFPEEEKMNGKQDGSKSDINVKLKGRKNDHYSETEQLVALAWKNALGFDELSIVESFYELGGDSILALDVVNSIDKSLAINIGIDKVLKYETIESLARFLDEKYMTKKEEKKCIGDGYPQIQRVPKSEYYVVSSAQKRVFLACHLDGMGTNYNISGAFSIEGNVDRDRVQTAFRLLVERHEALRTSFTFVQGNPMQKIHDDFVFSLDYMEPDEVKVNNLIQAYIRPFDLSKVPLFRVGLIKISNSKHVMVFDMHHIIADGMSMAILNREFMDLYQGEELSELKIQYKDFAVWQNQFLKSDALKKQEEYWLKMFSTGIPALNLPTDYQRPPIRNYHGDKVIVEMDRQLMERVNELAIQTNTTLYILLFTIYNILLSKYTGQEDVIVGSPVAGRNYAEVEGVIGMFVNMLAMRNDPSGENSFTDFLGKVKENTLKAFENQDYQFENLVEKLGIERDLSRKPLFDNVFVMQNIGIKNMEIKDLSITPFDFETDTVQYDILLMVVGKNGQMALVWEFADDLFNKQTVEIMGKHYVEIMEQVIRQPNIKLKEITLSHELRLPQTNNLMDGGDFVF